MGEHSPRKWGELNEAGEAGGREPMGEPSGTSGDDGTHQLNW